MKNVTIRKPARKLTRRVPASAPRSNGETRQRLLDAAGFVFAARGFRDATVREICAKAGANLAAVNYHFGDKASLYRELMLGYCAEGRSRLEPLRALRTEPEVALRMFVGAMLRPMLDTEKPAWHATLMAREMVEPTQVLDEVVEQMIRPVWNMLRGFIALVIERAGGRKSDESLDLATNSVIAQMLFYKHNRAVVERMKPGWEYSPRTIEKIAEHIADFSLAALKSGAKLTKKHKEHAPAGRDTRP